MCQEEVTSYITMTEVTSFIMLGDSVVGASAKRETGMLLVWHVTATKAPCTEQANIHLSWTEQMNNLHYAVNT